MVQALPDMPRSRAPPGMGTSASARAADEPGALSCPRLPSSGRVPLSPCLETQSPRVKSHSSEISPGRMFQ